MPEINLDVVANLQKVRQQLLSDLPTAIKDGTAKAAIEGAKQIAKLENDIVKTAKRAGEKAGKEIAEGIEDGVQEVDPSSLSSVFSDTFDQIKAQADDAFNALPASFRAATLGAGAATAGILALSAAYVQLGNSVAEARNEIINLSARTGVSEELLSGLQIATERAGFEFSGLGEVINPLIARINEVNKGSADAAARFERLGITVQEVQDSTNTEIFSRVVQALQDIGDESARAQAQVDIFGESGGKLGQILAAAGGDLDSLTEQARAYGTIVDEEAIRATREWNAITAQLGIEAQGAKNELFDFISSSVIDLEKLTIGFIGVSNTIVALAKIAAGLNQVLLSEGPAEAFAFAQRTIQDAIDDTRESVQGLQSAVRGIEPGDAGTFFGDDLLEQGERVQKQLVEIDQAARRAAERRQQEAERAAQAAERLAEQQATAAQRSLDAVLDSLRSEEDAIQTSYERRAEIVFESLALEQISVERANQLLIQLTQERNEALAALEQSRIEPVERRLQAVLDLARSESDQVIEEKRRQLEAVNEAVQAGLLDEESAQEVRVQIQERTSAELLEIREREAEEQARLRAEDLQGWIDYANEFRGIQNDIGNILAESFNRNERSYEAEAIRRNQSAQATREFVEALQDEDRERSNAEKALLASNIALEAGVSVTDALTEAKKDEIEARQERLSGIDSEIAALEAQQRTEQGLSETEQQRLQRLRNRSEAAKAILRQEFERQKRFQIASAIVAGASAAVQAAAAPPFPPLSLATNVPPVVAATAVQVAKIRGQELELHDGGIVDASLASRRLAPDEARTILRDGEQVLTRQQQLDLDKPPVVIINERGHRNFNSRLRDGVRMGVAASPDRQRRAGRSRSR